MALPIASIPVLTGEVAQRFEAEVVGIGFILKISF